MIHPILFKRTSTGALQTWECWTEDDLVFTRFGKQGGKLQTSEPTVCTGKQGRNAIEQAEAESTSEWTKKQTRGGYVLTREAALAGEENALIQGGLWPLLAQHYKDNVDKVKWPLFAQKKFNGHRCIAMIDSQGVATLWSRKRNPILSVPHIVAALTGLGLKNVQLDGELFSFDYIRDHGLEGFCKIVRKGYPIPGHEIAEYHVYDAPIDNMRQTERFEYLDRTIGKTPALPIVRAETRIVNSLEEAMGFLEEAVDEGQEGIMLRAMDGLYLGHPTHHTVELLKLKGRDGKCDDAEFKVVDLKEGTGKMAGKAIFICVTDAGNTFDVKMKGKGSQEQLRDYWLHPEKVVGKMITVEFNGWTKQNVPWFPRALQIREDL